MKLFFARILQFAIRVLRDFFFRNNGLLLSGAVAFNAVLSVVPLAALLIVLFSQFFDEELLMEAITTEVNLISPETAPMLIGVVESFLESRELVGWIGVVVLLFFSSIAFRVFENAFAIIFHSKIPPIKRRFWISALLPYLFIGLIALGLIVITALTALIEATAGRNYQLGNIELQLDWFSGVSLQIAGFAGLVLLFSALYKAMPVTKISYRLALSGGFTAAVMWELLRTGLVSYFSHISPVGAVYGSMASTIILLLTMEAVAFIILLGAQVIAELQRSMKLGSPWYEDIEEEQ